MTGELYIDNIDVYTQFGVWITEGGYDGLLSFPALQDPDKNIWPEEDGIEVDLSTPTLSGKEVSITFVASNPGIDVSEFITSVSQPGYRVVRIPSLNKEWKLRLLSQPDNVIYGDSGNQTVSFSLNFADDFPLRPVSSPVAGGSGIAVPPSAYSLDGTAFDRYGIFVEAGRDSLLKSAAVKQNLTRKFKAMDGVLYDAGTLVFKEKDVTFKCCLIADSIDRFWQCYDAFFGNLIKPGERSIGYAETDKNYKCYYKNTSGWKLASLTGRIIVEFSLTLVFSSFRAAAGVEYLMATEDDALVITEDDYSIDLSIIHPALQTYASAFPAATPAPASDTPSGETETRKRKITEMPEAGSLDNLIVPAVDRSTNQNVHIPADMLKSSTGGTSSLSDLKDVDVSTVLEGDILRKTGEKWLSVDPAEIVPAPVFSTLNIVGRFNTSEELITAFPNGPDIDGLYCVGYTPPYVYYSWLNIDGVWKWDDQGRLQVPESFLKQFKEISPVKGKINIDSLRTRYAMVKLLGDNKIFNLSVYNLVDGDEGYILVYQTGFKQISLSRGIVGTIDLPLKDGTVVLLIYNYVGSTLYIRCQTILGDVEFPVPRRIVDFQVVYSDSTACTVQWTSPWANNIYDKGSEYDVRYANSLAEANDPKIWAGLRKVTNTPEPAIPGTLQRTTLSGLIPNKEYYVYIKTIKVNYGAEYLSDASDFVYFRTTGSDDMDKAYRIPLSARNLSEQYPSPLTDTDGTLCSLDKMVDEGERNIYLPDGYPDTKNKGYSTYWSMYKYGRNCSPYDVLIDLFSVYVIDKFFLYSRGKPNMSIYGMKDQGYDWEKIGEITIGYNEWKSLDFHSFQCRFIKISFDLMDFGGPGGMVEGVESFPSGNEYNGSIDRIDNIILYGRPASIRPEGIMPPLRRSTTRKSVDQFFCVNGHTYQQGRIHSMCSGEHVRLYISPGHFASFASNGLAPCTRVADMRFNVNDIGWVKNNNGTGDALSGHLQNTYKKYGLRPYITFTSVFDYCLYDKSTGADRHNRQLDCYWLPDAWKALPKRGVGGLDKYFGVTMDAHSYKTMGKLAYALGAKYGSKASTSGDGLFWPIDADITTGLNLISGVEIENEPDQSWSGWRGYTASREYAAICSAAADGHGGIMEDEDGNKTFGIKRADAGQLAIGSGTAGINIGYYEQAILHWQAKRPKADIPVDSLSLHRYFSIAGNQHSDNGEDSQYAVNVEYATENMSTYIKEIIALRDRFCPDKELWITEFGYGEAGGRGTKSGNQCYSVPGRYVGDWLIPDRHRSDVKGSWIVRASMYFMYLGIDMVNYYSTECEGNYFDSGQWGTGPGFEMWHWNDCTDETPGAKDAAIRAYEHRYARGGFASMGLFGNILSNGAYPISRAYWWLATMRNRLKGYVYTGRKYLEIDERIMVFCFKHKDEDKGAYVVYLNDSRNTGVMSVEIPIPEGVSVVKHIITYVPEIANPENVPSNLGYDQSRTGLPTSRHERYTNGAWVVKSKGTYTGVVANYPTNPQDGDEIVVLPTAEENPYFPIVGPVQAMPSVHGNTLNAQQYETALVDDSGKWVVNYDISLAWRQVEAVCDYIDHHTEGMRGVLGKETEENIIRGMIQTNISEFPEYYLFDAIPEPDYRSEVTDLSSRTVSSSAIELWWNNTSIEDTGYQIFISELPETGYSLLKTISVDVENKVTLSGLTSNTTYYYKIRPIKESQSGTLSDYVSVKTYNEILPPTNFHIDGRTATSIKLVWDYESGQVPDFFSYAIYRSGDTGSYTQVGTVRDQSVHAYEDTGLAVGRLYKYKARVSGLNGTSVYTDEIETRTLLPEEVTPIIRTAITDKLGSKVILVFDLPLGIVPSGAKSGFSLTEDGNLRLIRSVSRDEANHNNLILSIPEDSLNDYDHKTDICISYNGQGNIQSEYGVTLEGFSNMRVANVIGNFTNINAVYQINLCSASTTQEPEWNNFVDVANTEVIMSGLVDTYGRTSEVSIKKRQNGTDYRWGNAGSGGYCEIEGIPGSVYTTLWSVGFGNNISESIKSRLILSGLNNECKYTVKAYGGVIYGGAREINMRIFNTHTPAIQQLGNKTNMLMIEDISPANREISIDFINPVEGSTTIYSCVAFVILEEYQSNDSPENTDVWLRDASIVEDDGTGVIKFPDVTIHLNCVGTATAYRIGEVQDVSEWKNIVDDVLDIPYLLSDGFGVKTLYVQVKNIYNESNIRVINIEYRDPYVPLVLKNIYINDEGAITYDKDVTILTDKEGIPTHYKIAETSSLSAIEWLDWPDPKGSVVFYILSDGIGQKTVYMQVKDGITESSMKVDTIEYINSSALLTSILINGGTTTTSSGDLSIGFTIVGTPLMMMISESSDFAGAMWNTFENPAVFTVSGIGLKTIYAKVKINDYIVSEVKFDTIELVDIPPVENKKLVLSIGWDKAVSPIFDRTLGINRLPVYPQKIDKEICWSNGEEAGMFWNVNMSSSGTGQNKQGAVTGDNSWEYPDEYMEKNAFAMKYNGISSIDIRITIPAGNYHVRLFNSTITKPAGSAPHAHYYLITSGYGTEDEVKLEVPQSSGYEFYNNKSVWIETDLATTGEFYVRCETVATGGTVTAPVNIIEIIPKKES